MHDAREYDAVVASGEQVTAGLLAIALQAIGIQARSWQGWQIPIRTSDAHASARILEIDGAELINRFRDRKEVAVIAGFQGINPRPGESPRSGAAVPTPRRWRSPPPFMPTAAISTPTSTASTPPTRGWCRRRAGSTRSRSRTCWNWRRRAPRCCRSARWNSAWCTTCRFSSAPVSTSPRISTRTATPPGTLICSEEEIMESHVVTGIAFSKDEAQISVRQIEDKPGVAASIFGPLAEANINVDMIVQNVSEDGATTDLTFTVPASDYVRARDTITSGQGPDRLCPARQRHRRRQGLGDRQRHAQPCRRRRQGVRRAGRAQHQHPRHHHLGNQIFGADRRRLYRTGGAHAAYALRARPGLEEFSLQRAAALRRDPRPCIGRGRRFAWQNKPQFAIRPDGWAAANCAMVSANLIRPGSGARGGAE